MVSLSVQCSKLRRRRCGSDYNFISSTSQAAEKAIQEAFDSALGGRTQGYAYQGEDKKIDALKV